VLLIGIGKSEKSFLTFNIPGFRNELAKPISKEIAFLLPMTKVYLYRLCPFFLKKEKLIMRSPTIYGIIHRVEEEVGFL
jgi:hypothetical protein